MKELKIRDMEAKRMEILRVRGQQCTGNIAKIAKCSLDSPMKGDHHQSNFKGEVRRIWKRSEKIDETASVDCFFLRVG